MTRDMDVRQTAYLLWEQDGKPEGRELDHWLAAEQMLAGGSNGDPPSAKKAPARRTRAWTATPKTASRSRSKTKESKDLQTPSLIPHQKTSLGPP